MSQVNPATNNKKAQKTKGRPPRMSTSPLGAFIQEHLDRKGIKRVQLARALGVAPSTIGRLIYETEAVKQINLDNLSTALALDFTEKGRESPRL